PEQQRAQQLSEKPGRDHQPDLRRGQLPERGGDRQHPRDRPRVEGGEERGDADDDPRLDLPPPGGQARPPGDEGGDRCAGARNVHVSLPWFFFDRADWLAYARGNFRSLAAVSKQMAFRTLSASDTPSMKCPASSTDSKG